MHDNKRLGPRGYLAFHIRWIRHPCLGVDVSPHDFRPGLSKRNGGSAECIGWDNDLIPRSKPAQNRGESQSVRRIINRKCAGCACVCAKIRLKLAHVCPLSLALRVSHDLDHCLDSLFRVTVHTSRKGHPEPRNATTPTGVVSLDLRAHCITPYGVDISVELLRLLSMFRSANCSSFSFASRMCRRLSDSARSPSPRSIASTIAA